MKLVICEKSSQAKNIKSAIGNSFGEVLAMQGHLIELKMPNDGVENYEWDCRLVEPDGKKVSSSPLKKKIAKTISDKLKTATSVIVATDNDVEGTLIGREFLDYYNYNGKAYRARFNAEDKKTIEESFKSLIPLTETNNEYDSGIGRQYADYILGLSMTQTISTKAGALYPIGRVKTPTLSIIARREKDIADFTPQDYYNIQMDVQNLTLVHKPEPLITNEAIANSIIEELPKSCHIDKEVKEVKEMPPKPLDLAHLCNEFPRKTIADMEEITQKLYDTHKIITYPRTESRYIPVNLLDDCVNLFTRLKPLYGEYAPTPTIHKGKKGIFFDTTDSHFAILPNANNPNIEDIYQSLNTDEKDVFDVICKYFIASMLNEATAQVTKYSALVEDKLFTASGKCYSNKGYLEFMPKNEPNVLKNISAGTHDIDSYAISKHTTTSPVRFTENSLAMAMKNVYSMVDNDELRAKLRETKGIGTQATRGQAIKGLKEQGLFEIKKSKIYLTEKGEEFFTQIETILPDLTSPEITARWELGLDMIREDKASLESFLHRVTEKTKEYISTVKSSDFQIQKSPSKKQIELAKKLVLQHSLSEPDYQDYASVKKFIDNTFEKQSAGELEKIYTPSEKQLSFAKKIAKSKGLKLSVAQKSNSKLLAKFINENKT